MEELENTNPVTVNPGENPLNPNDLEIENQATETQQSTDFSQLFSENITESTPIQDEPVSFPDTPNLQENPQETINFWESAQQQAETQVSEPTFEKMIEETALNNSQNPGITQQTTEQNPATEHQNKSGNSWFVKWILSGILLTLLVFVAWSLFAKNQVINAVNYLDSLLHINNVNYTNNDPAIENNQNSEEISDTDETEVIEENLDEINEIQQYYDRIDEILSSENDQETKTELLKNMLTEVMQKNNEIDLLIPYISQNIMDLTINSEQPQNEENIENQENSEEENNEEEIDNPEPINEIEEENNELNDSPQEAPENINNETIDNSETSDEVIEEQNDKGYTITHVNSEEEANWVLPAHCSDLTCYGEDKEFIECTSFKMVESLDENAHRIWNGWGCRYKDASELVYVEFSDAHNSAEETIVDSPTDTEPEAILEVEEPTAE